ncbi:MAG: tRNA (guanosine(46)-N7)-methyltransferase TrmB [Spirochaetales bacterium]|nr:tRNA (guanosine(46)-N7)-methyltransferase TrmB [Spirochaetales bacterium]
MEVRHRRVRSFVLRTARMSQSQRTALDELYPIHGLKFPFECDLAQVFPHSVYRVVEIGFGNGEATVEIAQAHPETGFLGIEVHTPGFGQVLREIHSRDLKNLKVLRHDAVEVVAAFEPSSIDGFHIFFPDPWQKKRHHKRRLLQTAFLEQLIRALKPGGYLYIATDWEEYAYEILETLNQFSAISNPYKGWAAGLTWRPRTKFEKRGREENRPIREIFFEKRTLE